MNNLRIAAAALAAVLVSTSAFAADNMTVKDSTGATVTVRSKDVGSGIQATVHIPFDSAGGDMTDTALHALRVEGVAGGVAQSISGAVGLTGTLPGFTSTPTFNVGAALPTGGNVIGVVGNAQGSTTSGQSGPLIQGAVTSGAPTYTTAQTSPLSLDTAGNLRVNLITGVLPTGAATAAKQPALGTAGTPSADVLTVQGATSMTPLKTDASATTQPVSAASLPLPAGAATSANQTTLIAAVNGAIPAGTAIIGKVGIDQTTDGTTNAVHLVAGTALAGKFGIDQTTPGTTNGVQDAATGAAGSAVPAKASYVAAQSGGNLTGIIQASNSAFLNMTTATTTKIITGVAAKKVYITAFRVHAGGTTTGKFVEGTGTNCATGTADLSETWDLTASDGSNQGGGLGPVLVAATAADDICFTNSAAVNNRIGVAYEIH